MPTLTQLETYEKMKTSLYFTKTVNRVSRDVLYDYYIEQNHTLSDCCKYFSISSDTFNSLLIHYSIEKSTTQRFKTRNDTQSLHKKEVADEIFSAVDLEELEDLYLNKNWSYEDIRKRYNLSGYRLDKIIKEHNLSKSRTQSAELVIKTKLERSEPGNYNNWKKGHETRIKNSGSLKESYQKGLELYKKTCLERYGYECAFSDPAITTHRKKRDSGPNRKFSRLLTANKLSYKQEFVIHTKSYDFYVNHTLLEINPTATHNSTFSIYGTTPIDKDYHSNKTNVAKEAGYRCIHVWDWDDKEKIVQSLLDKETIYARNCLIKQLNKSETDFFINTYHFQNTCKGQTYSYGLFYNGELIQVVTFGKPRYNKNYQYELLRLCTKFKYKVVGGAERLFKHFIKTVEPESIISYCDNSKFNGAVYQRIGMLLKDKGTPTKHWYSDKLQVHITDNFLRQRGFDQLFGKEFGCYGKGTDNDRLMIEHGFVEIYDCGQSVYTWKREH